MRIAYIQRTFKAPTLELIEQANTILNSLRRQGYEITLRQLYYQLVTQNVIRNKSSEYDRLGSVINDARLAGLVDWNAIIDRTRNVYAVRNYADPAELVSEYADKFHKHQWAGQRARPQVWVEKEALFGVIERPAILYDVPHFACRGYVSVSRMHLVALNLVQQIRADLQPVIIHLGDHDPSGLDMTRDIWGRIKLFVEHHLDRDIEDFVTRIALNYDQIEEYEPPPNPAKQTDSRFEEYEKRFGDESWELDALQPSVIDQLITDNLEQCIDDRDLWDRRKAETVKGRALLKRVSKVWPAVERFIEAQRDGLDLLHDSREPLSVFIPRLLDDVIARVPEYEADLLDALETAKSQAEYLDGDPDQEDEEEEDDIDDEEE